MIDIDIKVVLSHIIVLPTSHEHIHKHIYRKMSRASKIFLATSTVVSVGTIWGVHFMQKRESDVSPPSIPSDPIPARPARLSISSRPRCIIQSLFIAPRSSIPLRAFLSSFASIQRRGSECPERIGLDGQRQSR